MPDQPDTAAPAPDLLDTHAHTVITASGVRDCSFIPLTLRQVVRAPFTADDRIEGECRAPASHTVRTTHGDDAYLCPVHAAIAERCPDCKPLYTSLLPLDSPVVLHERIAHLTRHAADKLEVRPVRRIDGTATGKFYWRRRDPANHENIGLGQFYTRLDSAITGALRANPDLTDANLVVLGAE